MFIHKFDANDKTHDANQLPKNTIRTRLRRILLESGVAEHQRLERDKNNKVIGNGTIRHDVAASHGLRKFFDTTCMDAGFEYIFTELMMGHDVKLQESYYSKESKESQKKILIEYMKAINALTINEEARLKLKNTELAKKNKDNEEIIQQRLQAMKIRYEQGMKVMREEMENKFQQILTKIDVTKVK